MDSSSVFSSLPPDVDALCSAQDIADVRQVLDEHAGGWVTAGQIAQILGWPKQRTAEKVRRVKGELLLLGIPVVESHAGYKIAQHVSELDRCLDKEHARLQGLHRTIAAYEECRRKMIDRQSPLSGWS